ncbi:MAG: dihydroorotate dehydrogenase electron transfer subunit [Mailhella sp.]|nr:dihydroorotate dehydrogenase electron transfer subunit [Mailhella sp.]
MKQVLFTVREQQKLARDVWRMDLEGDASAVAAPGQFVEVAVEGFFLRRPISVCDCSKDRLTLVYKVVGQGTGAMSRMAAGDRLDLLTGLGRGFSVEKGGSAPLLIGGGVGVPPLFMLARRLIESGVRPTAVLGFNRADEVFFTEEFTALGVRVVLCTADGSAGERGFVTDVLPGGASFAYACGPLPMLRALERVLPRDLGAEFSLEERMGCGFGACMGCTLQTRDGARRVCRDGPVFPREMLLWTE